jgi:tetratricopeptide (TPR) repeat protein
MRLFVVTLLFALAFGPPMPTSLALDDLPEFPDLGMDSPTQWEHQKGPRTDWQDQRLGHGCVVDNWAAEALANQWQNLAASGHYDEAIEVLTKFISLRPNEPGGYLSRAKLYLQTGKPQQAKSDFGYCRLDRSSYLRPPD